MHLTRLTMTVAVFGALSATAARADTPWVFRWLQPAPAVSHAAAVRAHAPLLRVHNTEPVQSLQSGRYLVLGLGF